MKLLENFNQFYPNSTTQIAHDQVSRNFWQEYGHFFFLSLNFDFDFLAHRNLPMNIFFKKVPERK